MTNREWLENMSDEELASFLDKKISCDICICGSDDACGMNCERNIAEWFKQKHTEPMPKIKIGDVIYCNIGRSQVRRFIVMSDIYASNMHGIIERWRELDNIFKISRMNDEKGLIEEIWRVDDEKH